MLPTGSCRITARSRLSDAWACVRTHNTTTLFKSAVNCEEEAMNLKCCSLIKFFFNWTGAKMLKDNEQGQWAKAWEPYLFVVSHCAASTTNTDPERSAEQNSWIFQLVISPLICILPRQHRYRSYILRVLKAVIRSLPQLIIVWSLKCSELRNSLNP